MGEFSYDCSLCGEHEQFDWMTNCVVKIGDSLYVKGQYDGYGRVQVFVVHDIELYAKFQEKCMAEETDVFSSYCRVAWNGDPSGEVGAKLVEIYLQQFEDHFKSWHGGYDGRRYTIVKGSVVASDIYCCGDKDKMAEQAKKGERSFSDDEWEPEERYCVPDSIVGIRDHLLKSEMGDLPKVDFELDARAEKCWKLVKESEEWKRQMRGEEHINAQEYGRKIGIRR